RPSTSTTSGRRMPGAPLPKPALLGVPPASPDNEVPVPGEHGSSDRDHAHHQTSKQYGPLAPSESRLASPGAFGRTAESARLHRGREAAPPPDGEHEQREDLTR